MSVWDCLISWAITLVLTIVFALFGWLGFTWWHLLAVPALGVLDWFCMPDKRKL